MSGDDKDQNQNQNKGGGGSGGGGGGSNQQNRGGSKPKGKGTFDSTNIMGAIFWGLSAIMTSAAASALFLPAIPAVCAATRQVNALPPECKSYLTSATVVFVVALIFQLMLSIGGNRIRNANATRVLNWINYTINAWGLYYVFVQRLGLMLDLKRAVDGFTLVGVIEALMIIAGGYWLEWLAWQFFNAPPRNQQR